MTASPPPRREESKAEIRVAANRALAPTPLHLRIVRLLSNPNQEWPHIASEPTSIGRIWLGYVVPLSALGPLVGIAVLASGAGADAPKMSVDQAGLFAAGGWILGLAALWVQTLIAAEIAPMFGARLDSLSAFKLQAYSMTAQWVGVLLAPFPITMLLFSLYSLYLLWAGIPVVAHCPKERRAGFAMALVGAMFAIQLLVVIASQSLAA